MEFYCSFLLLALSTSLNIILLPRKEKRSDSNSQFIIFLHFQVGGCDFCNHPDTQMCTLFHLYLFQCFDYFMIYVSFHGSSSHVFSLRITYNCFCNFSILICDYIKWSLSSMGDQNVSVQINFWFCSRLSCNVTICICLSMAITSCYIIYAWFWCHRCKAVYGLTSESVCNHEHHWNWGKISRPVLSWEDAIWTVAMGWLQRKFLSFFSVSRDALKQKKWVSCSSPGFLLWIVMDCN